MARTGWANVDQRRRDVMRAIKRAHTKPEITVRRCAHRLGLRFRLHRKDLPGSPDIVLPKYRTVIFVHGCFWHHHEGCKKAVIPKTRAEVWRKKFAANVDRDLRVRVKLEEMGWRVLTVWECETQEEEALRTTLVTAFCLGNRRLSG